ncbi:hypothetical protein E3A20_10500, partial [Planctomyces bekefii]
QIDPTQRKVDYSADTMEQIYQSVVKDIPGLNSAVAPRTDPRTGEVIKNDFPILNSYTPVRVTQDKGTNPLDAQMDAIKAGTQKDPLLNDKQNADIEKIAKKKIYDAQSELIKNPQFQQLTDEQKKSNLDRLSQDIKAVEKRKYMADNQVGVYDSNYQGKDQKLSTSQSNIITNGVDTSKYLKSTDSKASEIPAGMNGYDVQTLERFAGLDAQGKDDVIRKESDAEYKLAVAEYERDKKLGKISKVEDIKRSKDLKRAEAGKSYPKEIREFYSLNKGEIYNYISSQPDGKEVADKLIAYDDALVKAGVIEKNKFRDKYGKVAFAVVKGKKGGKGRKGKGVKIASAPRYAKLTNKVKLAGAAPSSSLRKPGIRIASGKTARITGMKAKKIA